MKSINHFALALVAAFLLSVFAPAMAKTPAPGASGAPTVTKKAPKAAKSPAAKKTEATKSTEGKITKWSDNAFSLQAKNNKVMDFTYAKGKGFMLLGTPAVGKTAKVWYKSDKSVTKVEIKADAPAKTPAKTPAKK